MSRPVFSCAGRRERPRRYSTTIFADLSTTRGREGTSSQNIQILSHRESDRGGISAKHNCGHYQVVLIRAGTLPWSTGDALSRLRKQNSSKNRAAWRGCGPKSEVQTTRFGKFGDRNGLCNKAPNCNALHLRKTRANKKGVGPESHAGAWPIVFKGRARPFDGVCTLRAKSTSV